MLKIDPSECFITHYPDMQAIYQEAVRLQKQYVVLIWDAPSDIRARLFRVSTRERIHLPWEMTIPYGQQPEFFQDIIFQECSS
jgi:hypothetical protein